MDRTQALRRMCRLYDDGFLTPFLGAGMSRPACPDWRGFVRQLEGHAGLPLDEARSSPADLIRRADRVVRKLKHSGPDTFVTAVRAALSSNADVPAQTRAVGQIWWPLVLTTNYDDWFLWESFGTQRNHLSEPRMRVVGRGQRDCMEVLESLHLPAKPLLWALQGFVGGQHPCATGRPLRPELSHELVIGHEEYRRVTFTEPQFRQVFTEVFRSRALLFLGCGLADPYLLELFGQVLELTGPTPLPHFALVHRDEVDVDFLQRRLGIVPILYSDHNEVPAVLDELRGHLRGSMPRVSHWSFSFTEPREQAEDRTQFDAVRGRLPHTLEPATCLAVSAAVSKTGRPIVNRSADQVLRRIAGTAWRAGVPRLDPQRDLVVQIGDSNAFLCIARESGDGSHLRRVAAVTTALLDRVHNDARWHRVRVPLLAAGHRHRAFPPYLSLAATARAAGAWYRQHPGPAVRLTVHVTAPDVLFDLGAGRLDLAELISCDDIRLWVEVHPRYGRAERQPVHVSADTSLRDLALRFVSLDQGFHVEVLPSPMVQAGCTPVHDLDPARTLEAMGLVPGMTVRLSQ
jgi:hypothetical protein